MYPGTVILWLFTLSPCYVILFVDVDPPAFAVLARPGNADGITISHGSALLAFYSQSLAVLLRPYYVHCSRAAV